MVAMTPWLVLREPSTKAATALPAAGPDKRLNLLYCVVLGSRMAEYQSYDGNEDQQ